MFRFGQKKKEKKKFYVAKKPAKIGNIVISKLVETKTDLENLVRYLDKAITLLVLMETKLSGYVKTFKVKNGDKNENIKLMSSRIGDDKLLEK